MIEIEDYTSTKRAEDKRAEFEKAAATHTVTVQIDARREGVNVPAEFERTPNLLLKFSPRYDKPLSVGIDGIRQELTFPRRPPYVCAIPWSAIYVVHADKHGAEVAVWASDVPRELHRAFGIQARIAN